MNNFFGHASGGTWQATSCTPPAGPNTARCSASRGSWCAGSPPPRWVQVVVSVGLLAQLAAKAVGALTVVLPVIQGIHDSRQRESNLASGVAGASNSTG